MKFTRLPIILLFICLSAPTYTLADTAAYGSNPEAGQYAELNGIKMYYEIYGNGTSELHSNDGGL